MPPSLRLLRLLSFASLSHRLVEHPYNHKGQPAGACDKNARGIWPGGGDLVGVGIFIVGDVADGHGALLLNVAQKRPLVVGHEVENTVVVGNRESNAVHAFFLSCGALLVLELETVEGG